MHWPRAADVLVAFALITRQGPTIEDTGPDPVLHPPHASGLHKSKKVRTDGRVARRLYAPKGQVCGALLEDGSSIRMQPGDNEALVARE